MKSPLAPTLPQGHRLVETADGSFTLYSERFEENCHSTAGARAETLTHYLAGCDVEGLLKSQETVRVLEVGFATGLGWAMTKELAHQYPRAQLDFVSLELDDELIRWAIPAATRHQLNDLVYYELIDGNARLRVLSGDARSTLISFKRYFPATFQAIYQDAFSPKKNPTLWTVEWFRLLGELSTPATLLSTYSASISIRKALTEAGWGVSMGAPFGPKRTSTRARWGASSDPTILALLERSPTPALKDNA